MQAVITLGLPGCGKSTWAAPEAARLRAVIIERDIVRAEMAREAGEDFSWASWDFSREAEVTRRWQAAKAAALAAQVSVIFADTNLNIGYRRELVAELQRAGYTVRYVFFDVAPEVCRARNATRGPKAVDEVAYAKLAPGFRAAQESLADEARELGVALEVIRG
jgi:tRNA uridine 5-carbamoylmethylation protein Kti12